MMRAPIEQQRLFFGREYFVRAALRRPDPDFEFWRGMLWSRRVVE